MEVDITGLEFMDKEVYNVCLALVAIVDEECCMYHHEKEVEWAEAYIKAYEEYTS